MILKRSLKSIGSLVILLTIFLSPSVQAAGDDAVSQLMAKTAKPFISDKQIPGAAIAIYYNGQDYYFNYGFADQNKTTPITENTIFELASITKIFVTTLLAIEVQAGKLSLNDPIVKYIPKLANTQGLPINKVQVVNLATHTASFPRQMEQFGVGKGNIKAFFNRLKTWQPQVPIGSQYKYSNISFGLLGFVLVKATGEPLARLLSENITQPLGMNNTYFTLPQDRWALQAQGYRPNHNLAPRYVPANFLGGGALRSSAADLLKFMKANLGIKVAQASPQLLSAMELAQQPYFVVKPGFVMGLGWQRVRHGQGLLITKNGGNIGFSTFIGFSPSKKLGVVVLTNQAKGKATLLGNQILKGLLGL
ncbi:serine hydrolase [Legionella maioricensis]|uniref:Serine hydrolase n=1 Tax=Legionella maioricensis TaxID=2896528 RepID=A0A9X2CZZ3_9GAMM|nr:serine hydrolase [Legionella maioricensis]MCL9683703.1 serine hydrolase [Legionella maioricensis]MCL9687477.1 serine hydrolase [Legionella maioricensis]